MLKEHPIVLPRRGFLQVSGAALFTTLFTHPLLAAGAVEKSTGRGDWFLKNPRVYLLDFQMPDPVDQGVPGMPEKLFRQLDTRRVIEQCKKAGVDTFLVHAKCNQGNAYYNSKVCHKHSSLGEIDLMKEFSALCREHDMTILYYVQLTRERRSFTHPERRAIREDGSPYILEDTDPLLPSNEEKQIVCMNGPHRQYLKDILAELSSNYDFDGFWLDAFSWWGNHRVCYCETCRESYREDTGRELPSVKILRETEEGRLYCAWRQKLNTEILHELINHVRSINNHLTVTHNGSAVSSAYDWDFVDADDYVCQEYHVEYGPDGLALLCKKLRSLKPGIPFEVETWRFACRTSKDRKSSRGYQVKPVPTLLTEMASIASYGGFVQYYDQIRWDGTLDMASLDVLKPCFETLEERGPWTGRGEMLNYAGILWSKDTEQFVPWKYAKSYWKDFQGFHDALLGSQLTSCVLTGRDIEAGNFRGVKTVILASTVGLSDECIHSLEQFVKNGGGLVVTGESSLFDEKGNPRENFGLSRLLGVDYLGRTKTYYTFIHPEKAHEILAENKPDFPLTVSKTLQTLVKPREENLDIIARITDPMPGFHMGYPPLKRTDAPSLLTREFGKGRIVYSAAALGEIYALYSHSDTRKLIANAVKWAAGEQPSVTAAGPGTFDLVPWRDEEKGETIIHLINRTAFGPAQDLVGVIAEETIPLHDLQLSVDPALGTTATLQPSGKQLETRMEHGRLILSVKRLDEWGIIVLL